MNYELTPEGRARFGHRVLTGVPALRTTEEGIEQGDAQAQDIVSKRFGFLKPVRDLVEKALRIPDDIT